MKKLFSHIVLLLLLTQGQLMFSQQELQSADETEETTFTVRGSVYDTELNKPISQVNIEVNGGQYTSTNSSGDFSIQAKKGDELVIRHKDFETVYYTIQDTERIRVEVEKEKAYSKNLQKIYKRRDPSFNSLLDSAVANTKTDAEKSIHFITDALSESVSATQNSNAYETLADVYMHWNQYDLAVTNYEISLQSNTTNDKKLKLAKAFRLNKNYQESLLTYSDINQNELSKYQMVKLHIEGRIE